MKLYEPLFIGVTLAAVCLGIPLVVSGLFAFSVWPTAWQLLETMEQGYFRTMVGTLLGSIVLAYLFLRRSP